MNINPVGWFEIYVSDMERAKKFYEAVFDTKLETMSMPEEFGNMKMEAFPADYTKAGAPGALVQMSHVTPGVGGTLVYFSSDDCETEAARVEAAGGKIQQPKFSIGEYGFVCMFEDTEGNTIGLHSNQ